MDSRWANLWFSRARLSVRLPNFQFLLCLSRPIRFTGGAAVSLTLPQVQNIPNSRYQPADSPKREHKNLHRRSITFLVLQGYAEQSRFGEPWTLEFFSEGVCSSS